MKRTPVDYFLLHGTLRVISLHVVSKDEKLAWHPVKDVKLGFFLPVNYVTANLKPLVFCFGFFFCSTCILINTLIM